MLSKEQIEEIKKDLNVLTPELIEELRKPENFNTFIEILDLPKSKGLYVDAYGRPIKFDRHKDLKPRNVDLNLSEVHINEIQKCASDFEYFKKYIRIDGNKPFEIREYQTEYTDELLNHKSRVVGLMPRQCIDGNTELITSKGTQKIKDLFDSL